MTAKTETKKAAAQEMYKALRGLLALIAAKDGEGNLIPDHLPEMRAAAAALAKAEGR